MRININGVDVDSQDFARQQEEQENKVYEEYGKLRTNFDCNFAIINLQKSMLGQIGFQCFCMMDGEGLTDPSRCKKCPDYNNKIYEAEEH